MKSIDNIVNILCDKLDSVYCDTCKHDGSITCDDCHRKNMNWALSKERALEIAEAIEEAL